LGVEIREVRRLLEETRRYFTGGVPRGSAILEAFPES